MDVGYLIQINKTSPVN